MNNIPESKKVRERFIRSFEELRYRGLVKSKTEFCDAVGIISSSNLLRMEKNEYLPNVNNILLLHYKFGVSIEWIMLGKGDFLENTANSTAKK